MGREKGSPLAFRFQPVPATHSLRNGEQIRKCFHLFSLSGAVRRRPEHRLRWFRMAREFQSGHAHSVRLLDAQFISAEQTRAERHTSAPQSRSELESSALHVKKQKAKTRK